MAELTPRQLEIVKLVASGLSYDEIAKALEIHTGTVRTHLTRIRVRLGFSDKVHLTLWAVQHNLVKPKDVLA